MKMFNRSLETNIVPSLMKRSGIFPIPKGKNPSEASDYRPVSITPVISRFFERMIMNCFVSEQYNYYLPRNQHGFRKHASTTTAMILSQQQTATFQKTKAGSVRILSVDLSKAFDRVQHHIVIKKLSQVTPEINPFIINWVASFLKNR